MPKPDRLPSRAQNPNDDPEQIHESLILGAMRALLGKHYCWEYEERWMKHAWWKHGPRKQTHRAKKGRRAGMRGFGRRHP